jgi:hypothetical protein
MNIKHLLSSIMLVLALSLVALPASAHSGCKGKKYSMSSSYKCCKYSRCAKKPWCYPGLVRGKCEWTPGHWWNTTWVPASKSCWYLRG